MEDISLHILDIAENSIRADAKKVEIRVSRDVKKDLLLVEVMDDGKGMDAGTLARVRDPFFTTKHKKTGLGIPLLAQAAEQAGGRLDVESDPDRGTRVSVSFTWSNIDRPAVGNLADTLLTLIAGHPDLDFVFEQRVDERVVRFDTREVKQELDDVPINAPAAVQAIRNALNEQIRFEP